MVPIMKLDAENLDEVVELACGILHSGGVIVYPTDTVYGIGGDATSQAVLDRIQTIKQIQPPPKPFSVMLRDFDAVDEYCETGLREEMVMQAYLPGPYTFLLKSKFDLPVAKGKGKLGVRVPDNQFCLTLAKKFPRPIISTSANITSKPSPISFVEIDKTIIDAVDLAIDGGTTKYREASHIVDLVDWKVLRGDGGELLMRLPKI